MPSSSASFSVQTAQGLTGLGDATSQAAKECLLQLFDHQSHVRGVSAFAYMPRSLRRAARARRPGSEPCYCIFCSIRSD